MSTRPSRAHEVAHDREDHGACSADPAWPSAAPDSVPASRVRRGSVEYAGAGHDGARTAVAAARIAPVMQASTTVATTVDRRTPAGPGFERVLTGRTTRVSCSNVGSDIGLGIGSGIVSATALTANVVRCTEMAAWAQHPAYLASARVSSAMF
jgi:hypothetical protein